MTLLPKSGGRSLPSPLARMPMLNTSDNLPSYPPDNHHSSDDVYQRGGGRFSRKTAIAVACPSKF